MTESGPMDLIDNDNSDAEDGVDKQTRGNLGYDLPGALTNRGMPIVRTKCLRIAPTGRSFAAATTEGVQVYSIDDSFIFDPTDLDIDVTPEIFGGVGIACLPLGLIFSFIRRPTSVITRSQYIKEATKLGKKARELKKTADALHQEERSGAKGRKWRKHVKAVEKV